MVNVPTLLGAPFFDAAYYDTFYEPIADQQRSRFVGLLTQLAVSISGRAVLDVGCGVGAFLQACHDMGCLRSVGIDPSSEARARARERLAKCPTNVIAELPKGGERFGLVAFIDSLSHIPDLRSLFRSVVDFWLEGQGRVLIRTPVFSYSYFAYAALIARLGAQTERQKTSVAQSLFCMPSRHILFSSRSLYTLLDRAGLEPIVWKSDSNVIRAKKSLEPGMRRNLNSIALEEIPRRVFQPMNVVILARRKTDTRNG